MESAKFLEIKCPRCGNVQTTFGNATTKVKCVECNILLIKPRGGRAKVKARVKKVWS